MGGRKRGFRKSSIRCWQAAVTADFSAAEKPLDLMCPLGSRRFGTTWHGLSPVPGQKLIQLVDGVVVDAHKHVGEPGCTHPASTPGRRDGLPRSAQAATAALDCWFAFQFQGSRSAILLAGGAGSLARTAR